MNNTKVVVLKDAKEIATTAAKEFVRLANAAIINHGSFAIALSGGSTPKSLYERLARDQSIPWDKIHLFWGDERHVPPDHADSNFHMVQEALLAHISIPPVNVHRILAEELDVAHAAQSYENEIKSYFGNFPRFDLVLLGMGPDGHSASLFPGTKALHETERLVVSNWVGKFYTHRITLTAPVFNAAGCILFLVAGEDKSLALKGVLEGPYEAEQLPAQLIHPADGTLLWLIDQGAARYLEKIKG